MKTPKHLRVKIVTLESVSSEYVIKPLDDDYSSEFEIQAFLYSALKALGWNVRGEVKWCGKLVSEKRKKWVCRFDLVIFKDGKAVEILEIKTAPISHRTGLEDTRQGRRYRLFGVPVTFIFGMASAQEYLRRVS